MKIMITGSGGREDALAWRISQDIGKENLFIAPGNGGSKRFAQQVNVAVDDFDAIAAAVAEYSIDLLLVGPEDPLVNDIRGFLEKDKRCRNLKIVGPGADGAELEGSKDFAKKFMQKYNIPTAKYQSFTSDQALEAKNFLKSFTPPFVIKADGLAGGKGVVILEDIEKAKNHIDNVFQNKVFGKAGNKIVIEEFLEGIELSVFVLCDGKDYVLLPEAKDYKRIEDGDTGLNTGGMGTVSPLAFADAVFMEKVDRQVIKPTIQALISEKIDYKGFIFFGLMNVNGEPQLIEYNVRLGDPETQVILPRIEGNFAELLLATAESRLSGLSCKVNNSTSLAVVLVSKGYPGAYEKNKEIIIPNNDECIIFHAGSKEENGKIYTNGGRVLAVQAQGNNIEEARKIAYSTVYEVHFSGKTFRSDIGLDLNKYESN